MRTVRLQKNIPNKEKISLIVKGKHNTQFDDIIIKLCNLEEISIVSKTMQSHPAGDLGGLSSFMIGTSEYAIPIGSLVNAEEEIKKMEEEIVYLEGFLQAVMKKLSNERFVQNAKPEIVENERKKQADAESKIRSLRESIVGMKG